MVAIFIITIHIEIVIFPYFEKKKQIGFERTINSSLPYSFLAGFGAGMLQQEHFGNSQELEK